MRNMISSVTSWIDRARSMSRCVSRRFRLARRAAEQAVERFVRHGQADAIIEIPHVQPERTILLEIDQFAQD